MPTQAELAKAMTEMDMAAKSRGFLDAHKHLNFVQRILNPSKWPKIDNGDGSYSTQRMAWSTGDHGAFVYPTIVWDEKAKKLHQFPEEGQEAARYALKTGQFIRMSPADAEMFSDKGYKLGSGLLHPGGGLMQPIPQPRQFGGGLAQP
jgi:hypothetical protein